MGYQETLMQAIGKRSIKHVSDISGISENTIICWLRGSSIPTVLNYVAVVNACGYQLEFKLL